MTELMTLRPNFKVRDSARCHAAQRPVLCQASWPWRTELESSSAVESSRIRDKSSAEIPRSEGSESGSAGFSTTDGRRVGRVDSVSKFKRVRMDFTMEALLGRETSSALETATEKDIPRWLPPAPHKERARASHNAAALAYLGDSVYEIFARRHFLNPPQNLDLYSSRVTAVVCCEAQDWLLRRLMKQEFLTEEERDVLRWGRNAPTGSRKAKGRAGGAVYSSATSLETLVGYLYLTNQERLEEMMIQLGFGLASKAILPPVADSAG